MEICIKDIMIKQFSVQYCFYFKSYDKLKIFEVIGFYIIGQGQYIMKGIKENIFVQWGE